MDPTMGPSTDPTTGPSTGPSQLPSSVQSRPPTSSPKTASSTPSTLPFSVPSGMPTGSPSFETATSHEYVSEYSTHRGRPANTGFCERDCSGHGDCLGNLNCKCHTRFDGSPAWAGPDCSLRTCPKDSAWVGLVVNSNDLHPVVECSNKGLCDRLTGVCECFIGYEGIACQRTICRNHCHDHGVCWPEKYLAAYAGRTYTLPWDASKAVGCLCDMGYRGPSCELKECPSKADPLGGFGNEAGRDCSGRGICDYKTGQRSCFSGFLGMSCEKYFVLA